MKRVLLDQGLAPSAAAVLREAGWDAVHVSEVGLDRADDPEIIEYARGHSHGLRHARSRLSYPLGAGLGW